MRMIKIFSLFIVVGTVFILLFSQQKRVYNNFDKRGNIELGTSTLSVVSQHSEGDKKSSLIGIECQNYSIRPYAIFLENDSVARPLSGIASADLVIEMPVYAGITRLLAFYQCVRPSEVGSIRSARYDFITLVKNFDAILVHFGGEKSALELLAKGIVDNIDGLDYDGVYFYRKQRLKPPHNVFTDFSLLDKVREKLGYRSDTTMKWKQEESKAIDEAVDVLSLSSDNKKKSLEVRINYGSGYDVVWVYNPETREYLRLRDGVPEIDNISKEKVAVKNIIILETKSKLLDDQYNSVNVVGEGKLWYFVDSIRQEGSWYKKDFNSKLEFFDKEGNKLDIKSGKTWIEYIDQNSPLSYN